LARLGEDKTLYKFLCAALFAFAIAAPAHAEWQEARSNHFIVYADEPSDELRAYVDRLERFDKAVRIVRKMPDPALSDSGRLRIFVLPNEGSIQHLCGCDGVLGFYQTRVSGSVAFVPRKSGIGDDKFDVDPQAVFFHEYAHHLQMQGADVGLPSWASEGFAEFFARTEVRNDGTALIGVPPAYRAYSLFEANALSIRDMVGTYPLYYSSAEFEGIYARGWALTHYLAFNPSRRGQFDRYIDSIAKGMPPLTAAEQAFGDLGQLSSELGAYVRRKQLPHLILKGVEVPAGSVTTRTVSRAEADMLPVFIRAEREKKSMARDVASDAAKVAAAHPDSVFVQTVLAEAEFAAKDYAAADAASTRALALKPNDFEALVNKGKAQMELAKAGGAKDWHAIRSWFLKANAVDHEAAEPLMLFYKSYLYAGERPTSNAVEGLLYAMTLTPQDSSLRMMATRQLLLDGDLARAKTAFAPFAYSSHSKNAWRSASAKALTAIEEGKAAESITQVEKLQQLIEDER
jgi:Flp pilus assembly protein TadD